MKNAKLIAKKLRAKLREYNDFVGLYLYGSQITQEARADSDIDIVAIFENVKDDYDDIILKAWDIEIKNNVIIDFHPFSLKQLDLDPFYFNEVKKGIYYAR